jgi:hypothetical protein
MWQRVGIASGDVCLKPDFQYEVVQNEVGKLEFRDRFGILIMRLSGAAG